MSFTRGTINYHVPFLVGQVSLFDRNFWFWMNTSKPMFIFIQVSWETKNNKLEFMSSILTVIFDYVCFDFNAFPRNKTIIIFFEKLFYFSKFNRGCLVSVFKQQFSVFKQHFTYFNTLFHPHVFP